MTVQAIGNRAIGYLLARLPPQVLEGLASIPLLGRLTRRLSHALSPPGRRVWVKVTAGPVAGLKMKLDTRYEHAFWRGTYELELYDRLQSILAPGAVVYDVGAHSGYFTLAAARLVGPEGHIYAFEPDRVNAQRLEEHLQVNRIANVTLVSKAVWSRSGEIAFAVDETHFDRSYGRAGAGPATVEAITLDAFSAGERAPALIKIDVEGGECEVLRGAATLLDASAPMVLCEIHAEGDEHTKSGDARARLLEQGYVLEDLAPGREPAHILAVRFR